MLKSFWVQNFRVFQSFRVDGLSRINLFAGKNNSGKTCLLEAIFLHLGGHNPAITLRLNAWRGLERFRDASEAWGWLFNKKQVGTEAVLQSVDEKASARTLAISLEKSDTLQGPLDKSADQPVALRTSDIETKTGANRLVFRFTHDESVFESSASFHASGFQTEIGGELPFSNSIFVGTSNSSPIEEANRFSSIAEQLREGEVKEVLSIVHPEIKSLTVAMFGGAPTISADVGLGRLMPLGFAGEGVVRLARIVLAILSATNGAVLVDEIENGFHYSVHKKIWMALDNACRRANVQLFATTHSLECLLAAHQAFAETLGVEGGLSVYRLERHDDVIEPVRIPAETLENAESLDWEVR